jgi:hypothetical protein
MIIEIISRVFSRPVFSFQPEGGERGGIRAEYSRFAGGLRSLERFVARTQRTVTGPSGRASGALPEKFDARGLISRRLGRKGAFFGPFLTLNHFDFSWVTTKQAKKKLRRLKGLQGHTGYNVKHCRV